MQVSCQTKKRDQYVDLLKLLHNFALDYAVYCMLSFARLYLSIL